MQHFRRFAATAVVMGLGCGAVSQPAGAQALPPLTDVASPAVISATTQRGVPAEATAENAVIARTRAIASAQRIAYERMASEMGLPRGLSDSQIDNMVSSIIVEEERTSRTGYNGRLTVNFNPNRLPGAGGGTSGTAAVGTGAAAPPVVPRAPAVGHVQADVRYGGFRDWLEIRRRLAVSPEIATVDIESIAVDGARLRLGLRRDAASAAQVLPTSGLSVLPLDGGAVRPAAQPAAIPGRLPPPVPWGAAAPPVAPGAAAPPVNPGGASGGQNEMVWQLGLTGGL
ncbi:hypothetical protein ACFOD4_16260 [Pseudoroseomonas globiformis]|uniref:Uncharacterized protein n=1 Tax=Teichococcus globiformis TaxID=2307229 RepID=A0ABV7G1Q3_9PROT